MSKRRSIKLWHLMLISIVLAPILALARTERGLVVAVQILGTSFFAYGTWFFIEIARGLIQFRNCVITKEHELRIHVNVSLILFVLFAAASAYMAVVISINVCIYFIALAAP